MNTIKDQIKKSYKFQKELPKPLILEKTGPHPHRALRNPNQKMRKIKPPFPIILNYANYPPSKKKQNKKKQKRAFIVSLQMKHWGTARFFLICFRFVEKCKDMQRCASTASHIFYKPCANDMKAYFSEKSLFIFLGKK